MKVDPDTCDLLDPTKAKELKEEENKIVWKRVTFMLFSMLVSSSFLASYSITTFYIAVVYVAGSTFRQMFIWPSYKSFMWEAVETDAVLRLIDAIIMKRHEEDIAGEEETYRMLREILMCPELFKSICGSCLRGTFDPS